MASKDSIPFSKGSNGPNVKAWQEWAYRAYKSYASKIGAIDSYYGLGEEAFVSELQFRLHLPVTGIFDQHTADRSGFKIRGGQVVDIPQVSKYRPIWIYTAPGSGAKWDIGPSFVLGNMCRDILKLNHQPIDFQMGGYLGFMGGDPKFSYNEVIFDLYKSLEYLLDHNPDINNPDLELWFSGYSQSADGIEDALEILFGDGGFVIPATGETVGPGKYRHLRDRINGVIQFGNPSTEGTGIARKKRPEWLRKLIRNINKPNDFYAVVPASDKIRPAFYAIIIDAEMELPFFVHVLRIALPIILEWASLMLPIFGPLLGGFGPMVQMALPMIAGLQGIGNNPMLGGLMGQAGSDRDKKVSDDLYNLLKPTGLLENIAGLIGLISALPGLQAHGMYGPQDTDAAFNIVAAFRRKI